MGTSPGAAGPASAGQSGGDRDGERARELTDPATGPGEQVEQTELGEDVVLLGRLVSPEGGGCSRD